MAGVSPAKGIRPRRTGIPACRIPRRTRAPPARARALPRGGGPAGLSSGAGRGTPGGRAGPERGEAAQLPARSGDVPHMCPLGNSAPPWRQSDS
ncbi:hypothetical protein SCA03_41700 [Streptomyces cacaoi]|uniref:Uncharacterized protein n=1 Tax=Streptomyces cacaoi TaxID=1898 RepID=A0A4Y3R2U6_STRCI|nr:hypothetical protein SCA03_41700 [Streptomyces cacaoi]